MNQEKLKFTIDQLRKDKIIYATESTATNILMLIVLYFSTTHFHGALQTTIDVIAVLIAIRYTIYMGIGNFIRLHNIQKLEKKVVDI